MWKNQPLHGVLAHTQCKRPPERVPEGLSGCPGLLIITSVSLRKQKVLINPTRSANILD